MDGRYACQTSFFGRLAIAHQQRADKQKQHADGNRGIADIEDQKGPPFAEMQIGIVDAHSRAAPDRRCCRARRRAPSPARPNRRASSRATARSRRRWRSPAVSATSSQRPDLAVGGEQAQRNAGILDPAQVEEGEDRGSRWSGWPFEVERIGHHPFHRLVEDEDQEGDDQRARAVALQPASSGGAGAARARLRFGLSHSPPPRSARTGRHPPRPRAEAASSGRISDSRSCATSIPSPSPGRDFGHDEDFGEIGKRFAGRGASSRSG